MNKPALLSGLLLLLALACLAQNPRKKELEKQRASIQKEIDDVKRSLTVTSKNKKQTLKQLSLIQEKLRLREAQIGIINRQMDLIEDDIVKNGRDVAKLRTQLDTLKMQYRESIIYSYKNRNNFSLINFLFASSGFNDAFRRISYLRAYRRYREQQVENIINTQAVLKDRIADLNENKSEKQEVLVEQGRQRKALEEEKQEKNAVVLQLKKKEKQLIAQLANKKKQDLKLKAVIASVIRAEIAAAEKRRRAVAAKAKPKTKAPVVTKPAVGSPVKKPVVVPDEDLDLVKLSGDFESRKRKLPWPVAGGRISMHFGLQKVEGLRDLWYDNPGITLEVSEGNPVKAVCDGEVSAVFDIGVGHSIILKHGQYHTTYSNLLSVRFSKGQKVKSGDILGLAAEQNTGTIEVEFIVTKGLKENLDPEKWLRPR